VTASNKRPRGLAAVTAAGTSSVDLAQQTAATAPRAPLEVFSPDPRNHRGEHDPELEDLAARMRKFGQLQPVVVTNAALYRTKYPAMAASIAYGADYVVIMGNRRLRAAPLAGLDGLYYTVNDAALEHDDYREAALDENLRRLDLSALEVARILFEFLQADKTQEAVAARIGKSRGYVAQRLALLKLGNVAQEALEVRAISFDDARSLMGLSVEEQEQHVALIIDAKRQAEANAEALAEGREGVTPVTENSTLSSKGGKVAVPGPRVQRPPSRKALTGSIARYRSAFGTSGVAELVRNGLASEELPGFIADTARALEAPQLDKILADLTALRAELQEEGATE
jgi:ParB family transcriptional regulator, chromosome partitioning protein